MGQAHLAAAAALVLSSVSAGQLELNRLQLDNGGDILYTLSAPFVGSDPANGDYSGDLYYKVFPESVNTHCSGTWTWTGSEYSIFDDDWSDGATLYGLVLSPAELNAGGLYEPTFGTSPDEIFLPGGPITFPGTGCGPSGFLTGFMLRETYIDTASPSGTIAPAFADLPQDSWAISAFFPDGQTSGGVGPCGPSSNTSLSFLASIDENQPDWTPTPGASAYGGVQIGGVPGFLPSATYEGAEFALLVGSPMLNVKVDVGLNAAPFVEIGLAGLNPQLGVDASGQLTGAQLQLGVQLYSESSKPTTNTNGVGADGLPYVGIVFLNVGPTFLESGFGCLSIPGLLEGLGLNLNDPAFFTLVSPLGVNLFADDGVDWDADGVPNDGIYDGNLLPITPSAGMVDRTISLQAFTANALTSTALGSQVAQTTFRATN